MAVSPASGHRRDDGIKAVAFRVDGAHPRTANLRKCSGGQHFIRQPIHVRMQSRRSSGVVEDDHPFPTGGRLALSAANLDEPHAVSPQYGKYYLFHVAHSLLELVAGMCGDDDEIAEVEVPTRRLSEPAQQNGRGIDTHSVAHHHHCAAVVLGDAGDLILAQVHRDSPLLVLECLLPIGYRRRSL